MANFTGQLRQNEIFAAIFNMIISQRVFADNIAGTKSTLVDMARVDGSLYGDQKLYYATDCLHSYAWGNDAEATNLLALHRPDAPKVQAIVLDVFRQIPLTEDWQINPEDYKVENGGVIFPNPNAPTGLLQSLDTVEEIIQANRDVVVIVDEAYIDFGGESALKLIDKYDNLLVVQTFSKSRAMAGLRVGFCIGSEKLIGYLNDVKFSFNSYTMNMPSQALAVEAVKDDTYFKEVTGRIVATRERVKKELRELGFTFPDSYANFVFASHKTVPAKEIFEALREADIYVRHWDKPRIENYLRITIGTDEEMDRLIAFLKEFLAKRAGQ